jgi:hypothetical protein
VRQGYDDSRALAVCREALRQGHLTRAKYTWRFHSRHFPLHIVRTLIDSGEAVVVGEHCVQWRPQ